MTKDALTRKERDRLTRENDFMNAAEKLFAAKGYHHTSMEDVAKEAEYATGTIYRYFPSKEELYNAILTQKGKAFFELVDKNMKGAADPVAKLRAILESKVHFFFSNASFVKLYLSQVSGSSNTITPPESLADSHTKFMDMIETILKEGIKKSVFTKINTEMTVLSFMGMTNHLLFTAVSNDAEMSEEDVVNFVWNFLENGLIK